MEMTALSWFSFIYIQSLPWAIGLYDIAAPTTTSRSGLGLSLAVSLRSQNETAISTTHRHTRVTSFRAVRTFHLIWSTARILTREAAPQGGRPPGANTPVAESRIARPGSWEDGDWEGRLKGFLDQPGLGVIQNEWKRFVVCYLLPRYVGFTP